MEKIKFNIALCHKGDFRQWQEVDGLLAFEMFGYQWIAHESIEPSNGDFAVWEVSERTTGGRLPFTTPCLSADEAIEWAQRFLNDKGEHMTHKVIGEVKLILQVK